MTPDPIATTASRQPTVRDQQLRRAAEDLEATFLSEMLKSAGLGESRSAFGGGAGEEQFASMLRDEQARQMVKSGGIGLAETLFHSLKERNDD
ncbi:rod-binding protein [Pseudooceanicola onchidii]|uniref:rod-binding protein n=1 Tax=Pseudooceanicola onchidii TaxID=2562279 RepID=UPI0010AA54D6|nr:rod-binding protein [Pseudooceanicola onchidii]